MKTLQTITTIELSNICNLKCAYCINRLMHKTPERKQGIMSDYIFDASLELIKDLCMRGTQKEVNMHGNGESTLDPQLIERIKKVKKVVGWRDILLCTNAVTMTEDFAKELRDSGLKQCDVSAHSPYHARKAVDIFRRVGFPYVVVNIWGIITNTHNWAGQLEPENSVECHIDNKCDPLMEGRGYILNEGNITPCCYDYRNLGVFGYVTDKDILNKLVMPYSLCETCHQKIPQNLKAA